MRKLEDKARLMVMVRERMLGVGLLATNASAR